MWRNVKCLGMLVTSRKEPVWKGCMLVDSSSTFDFLKKAKLCRHCKDEGLPGKDEKLEHRVLRAWRILRVVL